MASQRWEKVLVEDNNGVEDNEPSAAVGDDDA